ncbi:VOC family protein [Deinococcus navajonensis]|uniref:VOC family protein n=1 Tax=Deinococcus navajonensis TaxID=309884 RepID=A0ABV8XN65_9DEIO
MKLYVPDLQAAVAYYQEAGLRAEMVASPDAPASQRARLFFPEGEAYLELHTDARQQFTDVQVAVTRLDQAYRFLSLQPTVMWLEPPHDAGGKRRATVRGPDGNVLILTEDPLPSLRND